MSLTKSLLFLLFSPITIPLYLAYYIFTYCLPYSDPAHISPDFFDGDAKRIAFWRELYENGANEKLKEPESEIASAKNTNATSTAPAASESQFLIIGSGFIGLSTASAFKRYGIPFQIIDKNHEVGGNWLDGVYESVHIISSKKTTEYKDYPMPEEYPDFPSAKQMLDYLKDYRRYHDIQVQFNCEAQDLEFVPEGAKWKVKLSTQEQPMVFKGVVLCDGHHSIPRFPRFPESRKKFEGEIMHSKQVKNEAALYRGKRVCIIGGGNSSVDQAVLAARYGLESHVAHRRGYWFLPRTILGMPLVEVIKPYMPVFLQKLMLHLILFFVTGKMTSYGLQKPDYSVFAEKHPTINSEILHFIKLGLIKPHREIKRFLGGKKVEFADGSQAELDLIVCCTGYHNNHPLVNKYVKYNERIPQVLSSVIAPSSIRDEATKTGLGERNLYVQGISQVRYGVGPLITMGSDLLAQIVCLQEAIPVNIGHFLDKVGAGGFPQRSEKSADILSDPHELWGLLLNARRMFPYLPWIYRMLVKMGVKIPEHVEVPGEFLPRQWESESDIDHIKKKKE